MISRDIPTEARPRPQSRFRKPSRAGALWANAASAALQSRLTHVGSPGGDGGGKIFDGNGQYRGLPGAKTYSNSLADIFRIDPALSDRFESDRPYEENVWVRACLKAIAEGFQRLRFEFYKGDPQDEEATALKSHPLLDLIGAPNQLMSERELWFSHAINMKLDGEVVWFLADNDGNPVEPKPVPGGAISTMPTQIIPVRGSLVEIEHDAAGMPQKYRYSTSYSKQATTATAVFPAASVLHFRDFDPYNITRGLGDVEALKRETDLYFQAFRSMDGAVRNGGEPGGFIIFDHGVDAAEMERRQEHADEEFSGPNQRRIKYLEGGAKFVPNPTKPSDMQYQEMVEWLRDSICSGLGVPLPVVGEYGDATMNNVDAAHREMWTGPNGILALAARTSDTLTMLLKRMALGRALPVTDRDLQPYFNPSGIAALQEDGSEKLKLAAEIAGKGVAISFNEAAELLGVEGDLPEEGDTHWVGSTLNALEDPEMGKPEVPEPLAAGSGEDAGEVPKGKGSGDGAKGDKPKAKAKSDSSKEAGQDSKKSVAPGSDEPGAVTFSPQVVADDVLAARITKWLTAYEREARSKIRRIANGGFRQFNFLDDSINWEAIPDEVWDLLLLKTHDWAERFDRDVRVAIREVYAEALKEARGEVGGPLLTTTSPTVVEELAQQIIKVREGVASSTARRTRNAIARVMTKQNPPGSIRESIKAVLPELDEELAKVFGSKEARAAAISRTETGRAENGARYTQFRESNVQTVEWVASSDGVVRPSHAAVNGTTAPVDGRFGNGLRYPHDPLAPASEVVNCRCKIRAVELSDPFAELDQMTDDEIRSLPIFDE